MPHPMNSAGAQRLPELEYLGDALPFTAQLHAMLPYSPLFESLQLDEVRALSPFLQVYRAQIGQTVLREGEAGDFMLFVIEGRIDVFKEAGDHASSLIAVIGAGKVLGEMSLIDGDPRSATCIADAVTLMAALSREALARIIVEQPLLGAKILMGLVVLLSFRLRKTSAQLLSCLEQQRGQKGVTEVGSPFV